MKHTCIVISITYFGGSYMKPMVHYYRRCGAVEESTFDELTVDEANRKMWELVKLGGKNIYESNWFNNSISTRQVIYRRH